jgi:hypothetical protein
MARPQKTAAQLEAMIMDRIKSNSSCSSVLNAVATPLERTAEHHHNWHASFITNGAATAPEVAFRTAREIASQFDLVEPA